jgi:rubrerythrin
MMALLGRWLARELPKFYRLPDDQCDECGYSMTGIHSPVCPECGEPIG